MSRQVVYCQLNKDYAYWTEKRRVGQIKGGQVSGLLSFLEGGQVKQNILFDVGLGTLEAIADWCDDSFWDTPLQIFITHGHIDHHAELMVLSEIYYKRRGATLHDVRPPLPVFCTGDTHKHLFRTHQYGYTGGESLAHAPILPDETVAAGPFQILPLAVDHFEGAVIYVITFALNRNHKIVIGWDLTSPPLAHIPYLRQPSLALFEATTWTPLKQYTGHICVEELVSSGFLAGLQLQVQPERERYGAYLVHYSGWEDPWGMLTDAQLKQKFDDAYPSLAGVVRMAERGQRWLFS